MVLIRVIWLGKFLNRGSIMEKEKEKLTLREILKNKQYKAIIKLGFYFILIFVLIVYVRTAPTSTGKIQNGLNGESVELSSIYSKNFNFRYTLTIGNKDIVYNGKQYLNKVLFTDLSTNKKYFIQDSLVLEYSGDKYVLSNNPVQIFNYIDVELLAKILSESVKDDDDYVIEIDKFLDIIGKSKDNVEENNEEEILIETEQNDGQINKIVFNIPASLYPEKQIEDDFVLELEYFDFGKNEDFNVN